jgi:hypothetical protein
MSTYPSNDPAPPQGGGGSTTTGGGREFRPPVGLGMMPGSSELAVWLLALLVAALVCWIADTLGPGDWMTFFLWTTAAYLLSRGIAKASRVYEM